MESTLNISANLRAVDTIKSEILSEVSNLYRSLSEYNDKAGSSEVAECIATIICMDYILARRAGISFRLLTERFPSCWKWQLREITKSRLSFRICRNWKNISVHVNILERQCCLWKNAMVTLTVLLLSFHAWWVFWFLQTVYIKHTAITK